VKRAFCIVLILFAIVLIFSACSKNQTINDGEGASIVDNDYTAGGDGVAMESIAEDSNMPADSFIDLNLPLVRYNATFALLGSPPETRHILFISPAGELVRYERRFRFAGTDEVETFIVDTNVRSVTRGFGTTFWLKNDNTLWAQGSNSAGVLGDNTGVDRSEPVQILDNVATFYYSNGSAFAILNDQSLWAWGWGERHQLGTGEAENRYAPTKILDNVVKVYTQDIFTFALLNDGSLYVWGTYSTTSGQPSVYDAQPRRLTIKCQAPK